ncbi:MAG: BolA family transcriptional regulator [Bdellovibrionales bacterium]|nr:BolA family transcriptional regulator [Bdellovibrionales bacterium]
MPDSRETARRIEEILRRNLEATEVAVEDQSHLHAGHRQARGGGHFSVVVRSARFEGLAPLARQRLVIEAVGGMMDREIHALSMRCLVP